MLIAGFEPELITKEKMDDLCRVLIKTIQANSFLNSSFSEEFVKQLKIAIGDYTLELQQGLTNGPADLKIVVLTWFTGFFKDLKIDQQLTGMIHMIADEKIWNAILKSQAYFQHQLQESTKNLEEKER